MNSNDYPGCAASSLTNLVSNLTPILYYNPPRPINLHTEALFTDEPAEATCIQGSVSCFYAEDIVKADLLIEKEFPNFKCSFKETFGKINKGFRILHCINHKIIKFNMSESMKDNDFMVLHGCLGGKDAFKVFAHMNTTEDLVLEVRTLVIFHRTAIIFLK